MRCRRSGNTDGPRLGHPPLNAATVLRIGNCVQNGRLLFRGVGLIAGDAATPSFRVRLGNWGMTIMTALYIVGLSIGGAIRVGRALKHTMCEGIKIQSRDRAQNGEKECAKNGEMNRLNASVFSLLRSPEPARLEISLSPPFGVSPAEGAETGPESPVEPLDPPEPSVPSPRPPTPGSGKLRRLPGLLWGRHASG